MKHTRSPIATSILCAVMLAVSPLAVRAEDIVPPGPTLSSPVIITEIQTGSGAGAGHEFIELYNASAEAVDITGWQLRFIKATATSANPLPPASDLLATIVPDAGGRAVLAPGEYYVLKNTASSADIVAAQKYATAMTNTIRLLALFAANPGVCLLQVQDAVTWSGGAAGIMGEGAPLASLGNVDVHVARYANAGLYVDTDDNAHDFTAAKVTGALPVSAGATPGAVNTATLPVGSIEPAAPGVAPLADVPMNTADCTVQTPPGDESTDPDVPPSTPPEEDWPPAEVEPPAPESPQEPAPQPTIPAANTGLKSPVLSELLPNPAPPQTDKDDEFIELYNPNGTYFDLSGYVLEVGLTTKRRYVIPSGTKIPPRTFVALFSAQTNLAMSNSGSQVALLDPLGRTLALSEAYGTAKDGQAWVFASGIWQWTTKPTPNALNVVSTPTTTKKASATKKTASAKVASAKTTSSSNGQSASSDEDNTQQLAALAANSSTPLHPGVLALIAGSAVLYGAYEYRRDVANRIYQFRANRAARRALRQSAEGQ